MFRLAEVAVVSHTDLLVIFIALAIEDGIELRLRGEIVKGDLVTTIACAFSFDVECELLERFQ